MIRKLLRAMRVPDKKVCKYCKKEKLNKNINK